MNFSCRVTLGCDTPGAHGPVTTAVTLRDRMPSLATRRSAAWSRRGAPRGPRGDGRRHASPAPDAGAAVACRAARGARRPGAGPDAARTTSWSSAAATTDSSRRRTSPGPGARSWCSSGCPGWAGAAVSRRVRGRRRPAVGLLLPREPAARPDRHRPRAGRALPTAPSPPTRRSASGRHGGLLVERDEGPATAASFRALTGSDAEFAGWQRFYGRLATLAEDLPDADRTAALPRDLRGPVRDPDSGTTCGERPLADVVADRLSDDVVRGVALTDGLIGTFADVHAADGLAGRCFLYHLIGNGTGRWRVPGRRHGRGHRRHGRAPPGGGRRAASPGRGHRAGPPAGRRHRPLDRRRRRPHASTRATSSGVRRPPRCWPGSPAPSRRPAAVGLAAQGQHGAGPAPPAAVRRRPRDGASPAPSTSTRRRAAGRRLRAGRRRPAARRHPVRGLLPLADRPVDPRAGRAGRRAPHAHAVRPAHARPSCSAPTRRATRDEAVRRVVAQLDAHLEEPLLDCLARDARRRPCLQAASPLDVEASLAMPGGHIFHGDLSWPVAATTTRSAPGAWRRITRGSSRPPAARSAAARSAASAVDARPRATWLDGRPAGRPGALAGSRRGARVVALPLGGRVPALLGASVIGWRAATGVIAAGLTFYAGIAVVPLLSWPSG